MLNEMTREMIFSQAIELEKIGASQKFFNAL